MSFLQPTDHNKQPEPFYSAPVTERPVAIYVLACFLGAVLISMVPILGIPLVTYGTTVLMCKGKAHIAWITVVLGAVPGFMLDVPTGVCCLVLGVITLTFTRMVPEEFGQGRWLVGVLVIAALLFAIDTIAALVAGTTISGQLSAMTSEMMKAITAEGMLPAESIKAMKEAVDTVATLWPSFYFLEGVLYMTLLLVAARVAYRRHREGYVCVAFGSLDLSVHFAWVLVAGLLCIAASNLSFEYAKYVQAAGLNLLVCAAVLFMIQGFAVISFLMNRARLHIAVKVIVYVLALQMEAMFVMPSLVGVLDFWINFRKLPRAEAQDKPSKPEDKTNGMSL